METSRARILWTSQCAAVPSIREKFGLQAALDYLISEKLLNFAERAVSEPDFARELPIFVSEIRQLFTPVEIRDHLAVLVLSAEEDAATAVALDGEDDFSGISPQEHAARCERLAVIREVLEADQLGTS
jgi:hypothetical protein